jgi:hypothetical protein
MVLAQEIDDHIISVHDYMRWQRNSIRVHRFVSGEEIRCTLYM